MGKTAKTVDVICMDIQQSTETGEENSNTSNERTSTPKTTTDAYSDDESSETEVRQLQWDYRCLEKEMKVAICDADYDDINEVDQNRESGYGTKARCAAEVQQSPRELQRREDDTQETREDAAYDDSESSSSSDADMPILVGRQPRDADNDSDSSDESFDYGENEQQQGYHSDNDYSNINDGDDDSNNIMPGLQERTRDNSSSKEESVCNHDHADHNP